MQLHKKFLLSLLCLLMSTTGLLHAQSTVTLVKRGKQSTVFSGGVFIGWGASFTSTAATSLSGGTDTTTVLVWKELTGLTQSGTTITKTASNGWGNAGVVADNRLDTLQNGWVNYKVTSLISKFAFGLVNHNADAGFDSIEYAVMVDSGTVAVYNKGILKGTFGSVALNDSIRIERIGNSLFYTKNNTVFYNQQVNPKEPVQIDLAIYTSGAAVTLTTTASSKIIKAHFRSAQNGNWGQLSTWQTSADSTTWTAATIIPDHNSKSITIGANDTVTITSSVTIDNTVVNGTLIYGNTTGNTITINNGTGTDLIIHGTFEDIGPNDLVWADSTASWAMDTASVLLRTRSTSSDKWRDHYQNGIAAIPATANWIVRKTGTDTPLLSSASGMYYPNLTIENTSGSTWTTSGSSGFTGSLEHPHIKGNFNVGGNGADHIVFVNQNTDTIPVFVGGNLTVKAGSTLQNNGSGFNLEKDIILAGRFTGLKKLSFSGTHIQSISDTTFSVLKILTVNKTGGQLKLKIPVTIDSLITLTNGNVDIGDTTTLTINNGIKFRRTNGYISTTGTGVLSRTTASINPYLFPLGYKTTNDSADLFVVTLTPGKTPAQKFQTTLTPDNTGFVIGYDSVTYGTGTEIVKLDIATKLYNPIHIEYTIDSFAHINRVQILDPTDNTLRALPTTYYRIVGGILGGTHLILNTIYRLSMAFSHPLPTTDLNWVDEISYDANGLPVSEQKKFIDFIGRSSQMLVRNMAENTVVLSQTLYDNYGRAAAQTLPAPVGNTMAYQASFITVADGSPYDYTNFDSGSKVNAPDAVSPAIPGTVGAYYSDFGSEAYIATTSYPYTRTEFTADPSSAAKRSAKAGDDYRMGSGHESKSYTMVAGDELKYIFGTNTSFKDTIEAGDKMANHALAITGGIQATKTISIDAGGKEMVSYSAGGLAIAACYTGLSDGCSMTTVTNTMQYAGTASVDIHLPAAGKSSLKFPLPEYTYLGTPTELAGACVNYTITDLSTSNVLVQGTDYTLADDISGVPTVTFLGAYASGSSVFRISFSYASLCQSILIGTGITPPDATVSYSLDYSRWSVNYYDLAGRLRKSVSPLGITCSYPGTVGMATTYDYSSMGQLIASKSPDEGLKEITYDSEGKARFTQNVVQSTAGKFSYSDYDAAGRAVESGEYATGGSTGSSHVFFQNYYGAYIAPNSGNIPTSGIINNLTTMGMDTAYCSDRSLVLYYPLPANNSENIPSAYSYVNNYKARYLMGKVCKTKNAQSETWYSYNQAGQTVFTLQRLKDAAYIAHTGGIDDQVKTVDYTYNTANGTLTDQTYQQHVSAEKLQHNFNYDANLRLNEVDVAVGTASPTLQAKYFYYLTGALKRKELGDKLQGIDYIYTVNGQLKSINHPSLDDSKDPGLDGHSGSANEGFGKDVFGLTLDYHANDYTRTGSNIVANTDISYYTGLISALRYKTRSVTNEVNNGADYIDYGGANEQQLTTTTTDELMTTYKYDDEYRLNIALFGKFNNSTNTFTANSNNCYKEYGGASNNGIGYDLNGNITTLKRNGYNGSIGLLMDDLTYTYTSNTNQLASIADAATSTYSTDFDASGSKSFSYNANGQMTRDAAESIADNDIEYTVRGLVSKVTFDNSNTAEYWYNDRGQKVKTKYYDVTAGKAKYTWYVTDAGGNALAIYEYDEAVAGTPAFTLVNQPVYGSGRIGVLDNVAGIINYEVTDHLGNVRATIKATGDTNKYELTSRTDYYAFGGAMPGRTYNLNTYRYNYQGQENAVNSNWQDFELRMHNSDLGRFMTPDPNGQFASPYVSMGNNPISGTDPTGGYYIGGTEKSWNWGAWMFGDRTRMYDGDFMSAFINRNRSEDFYNMWLATLADRTGPGRDNTMHGSAIPGFGDFATIGGSDAGQASSAFLASGNLQNDYQASNGGSLSGFFSMLNDAGVSTQDYLSGNGGAVLINGQYAAGNYVESYSGAYGIGESNGQGFGAANDLVTTFNGHTVNIAKGNAYSQGRQSFGGSGGNWDAAERSNQWGAGSIMASTLVTAGESSEIPPAGGAVLIGGTIMAGIAAIHDALLNPNLEGTHTTYQHPSQSPLNNPMRGFDNEGWPPNGNWGNGLFWGAVGFTGYIIYDNYNTNIDEKPTLPILNPADKTYVAPPTLYPH